MAAALGLVLAAGGSVSKRGGPAPSGHGEGGDAYRDAMASDQGWTRILESYAAAVS